MTRSRRAALSGALALVGMLTLAGLRAPMVSAQGGDSCPHEATISSLQVCVQHMADAGFIDNPGVTRSLLAKLAVAQAAVDRGQLRVAAAAVQACNQEVRAQRGKHIDPEHADHLLMHARLVIAALGGR